MSDPNQAHVPRFWDRPVAMFVVLGPLALIVVALLAFWLLKPGPSAEDAAAQAAYVAETSAIDQANITKAEEERRRRSAAMQ